MHRIIIHLLLACVLVSTARAQDDAMSLNVRNMPVQELVKLIAEQGQLDIAIEPGISGNVTMFIQSLAPLRVLDIAVEMLDAAYIERNGVYVVMTATNFEKRTGEVFRDQRVSEWFQLEHVAVHVQGRHGFDDGARGDVLNAERFPTAILDQNVKFHHRHTVAAHAHFSG